MGRIHFAPQVSGSGEGAMPELGRAACGNRVPADRTVAPPSAGSGISDPRSARPSMGRNVLQQPEVSSGSRTYEFAPQYSPVSSRRRLTNPKG